MDQFPNLPPTPAPDPAVEPMDQTFRTIQWNGKNLDKHEHHNEPESTLAIQGREKVARWMTERIETFYCEILPSIPNSIYPIDNSGNFMHIYPLSKPHPETLPSPVTTYRASLMHSGPKPTLSPKDQHASDLDREKSFYELLTKAGGRPWYPVERLQEISDNPGAHQELLRFWKGDFPESKPDDWKVFERQWERWNKFRYFQVRARTPSPDLTEYFVQCHKILSKHFLPPFHLGDDPSDQDELSQWLEYLCFEDAEYKKYSWYTRYHKQYRESWEKLVDSKTLKRDETRDYAESAEFLATCDTERASLMQAVEAARSNVLLAERDRLNPTVRGPTAQRQLFESQAELDSAINAYDGFKRRKDAIDDFREATAAYREARRGARRHRILLRWAHEQVPLIEKELGLPASTKYCAKSENKKPLGSDSDWSEEEDTRDIASSPLSNRLQMPYGDRKKRVYGSNEGPVDTPPKRARHQDHEAPVQDTV
ncbi:hypothetical protein FZEAL_403 [Fusarium zealandicum]|uniref:Uncharacterized protein n=1 Tax=Fusarium zealandicum TaxID=1053134 RepID=A0A8H4XPU4_9HYPO|nr:hypothetical protein FZEAL_403 [Fusarium zealandicum]